MKNIFVFSLLLLQISVFAQLNPYSPEERYRFGRHLYDTGDYLRACDELSYFASNDTARFLAALSLSKLERYSESNDRLRSLSFNSELSEKARFMLYKNAWFSGDSHFIRNNRSTLYFPKSYEVNVESLAKFDYLLSNKMPYSGDEFVSTFNEEYRDTAATFYKSVVFPKSKNPVKAAWLSTIIPGAGKIYTENYGDGITAFLFVGVLTYLAVNNFNADHKFRGYLFSGLAAYFYAGNIYGSYSSAQIFNVKYRTDLQNEILAFLKSVNYFEPDLW